MKTLIKSKKFKLAAFIVLAIMIILASFVVGVGVGFKKAKFSYRWGENYERNFLGPRHGESGIFPRDFGENFRNAHGLAGEIISITDGNLVIKDRSSKENTVSVSDQTIIKRFRDNLAITDLKSGDQIVILGKPGENGTITAELIRVFNNINPEE